METTSYAIALGSNRRHGRHGSPKDVVEAALEALADKGVAILAQSAVRNTPAMGGAGRRFANAAAVVATDLPPATLLTLVKRVEREFGRRSGRRWGPRVLDLDIIAWSGGLFRDQRRAAALSIPHVEIANRAFVLRPLLDIAPDWRHPVRVLTVRQLWIRLNRANPVDRLRCYP